MKLRKEKKGSLFLHTEIGKGSMPDGREVRLIQTNSGIHMQVYDKDKEKAKHGGWDTYTLTYDELSQSIFKEVKKIEEIEKNEHTR